MVRDNYSTPVYRRWYEENTKMVRKRKLMKYEIGRKKKRSATWCYQKVANISLSLFQLIKTS
jgi:hypothetical protein